MRTLLIIIWFLPCFGRSQEQHKVSIDQGLPTLSMQIDNVPEDLDPLIDLFLLKNGKAAPVQVSGKYWLEDNEVFFKPHKKLQPGFKFEAVFYYSQKVVRVPFEIPSENLPNVPLAEVEDIYPLNGVVPENVLYFQFRFSQPMKEDAEAYRYVHIGSADTLQELTWRNKAFWLDSGRVLILMIHPGRVKRGIDYMSQLGDLFSEGELSVLHVSRDITDAQGRPLAKPFSKSFKVSKADRVSPKIIYEDMITPNNSLDINYIEVVFSEQMNYASVIDGITVVDENKHLVDTRIVAFSGTSCHVNHVDGQWPVGEYTLIFSKVVADLANNRLNRTFEVEDVNDKLKDVPVEVRFKVKN